MSTEQLAPESKPNDVKVNLESLYRNVRAELYRALVLITGNRDVATEAVDRGYRSWNQRLLRRATEVPAEVDVLRRALRWARRKVDGNRGEIQGFRLPGPELGVAAAAVGERIAAMPFDRRAIAVATHYLEWPIDHAAVAANVEVATAKAMLSQAMVSLADAGMAESAPIHAALVAEADTNREPLSRLESVRAQSTSRRILAFAGAAAVTIGVVGGGIAVVGSGDTVVDPPPSQAANTDPDGGLVAQAGEITWTQVQLPIQGGEAMSVAHGPAGFIVMAQEFAGPGPTNRILQSDTGVDWVQAGQLPGNGDVWIQQITVVGDQYIAIGNAFDENRGRESIIVYTSSDGVGWSRANLPVEDAIEIDGQRVDLYTWISSVSGSNDRIALIGNQGAEFDPESLIRDAVPADVNLNQGWGFSEKGIEVYDNQGRVSWRASWDELEIDAELAALLSGGRTILWTSTDGVEWEASPLAFGVGSNVGQIALAGNNAAGLVHGNFAATVWSGPLDGEWTPTDIAGLGVATGLASLGDEIIVLGTDENGVGGAWVSANATDWERIVDDDLGGNVYGGVSASGAVAAFGDDNAPRPVGPAIIDLPEGTLEISAGGGYTLTAPDGAVLLDITQKNIEYEGNDVKLLDPDTGEVVVSILQEEIDIAWELMFREFEFEFEGGFEQGNRFIIFSTDGREWVRLNLSEVAGQFYPQSIAISGDTIVLSGFQEDFEGRDGPPPAIVWVGSIEA